MQIIPLLFVIFVQKSSFFIRNARNTPTRFANISTYTPARLYGIAVFVCLLRITLFVFLIENLQFSCFFCTFVGWIALNYAPNLTKGCISRFDT